MSSHKHYTSQAEIRNQPTQSPASPPAVISALDDSLKELRPLIEKLYENKQQAEGLLLSQVKLLFVKLRHGITAQRSDFISVLQAAGNVRGEKN